MATYLQRLKQLVSQQCHRWGEWLSPSSPTLADRVPSAVQSPSLEPLRQVVVTEGVTEQLFREYLEHRQTERRDEETGWLLLGLREGSTATVLATLPAGADRDAGEAHVRFNSVAQAVAMRMLFPIERRLKLLGVVHTHPGTLRHPSREDYHGDRAWVRQLPGQQGLFGIGTLTRVNDEPQPAKALTRHGLRFDWYTLAAEDRRYQTCNVQLISGPDLAADLRRVWTILEDHAADLDRLARLFAKVRLNLLPNGVGLVIGLPEPNATLQVTLTKNQRQMMWDHAGQMTILEGSPQLTLEQAVLQALFASTPCEPVASAGVL